MKQKVLILCTGNSCRSQMAEGLLKQFAGDRFEAFSAGTAPTSVNPKAVQVMQESEIDISQNSSTNVNDYLNQAFDYVITVCDNARENCPHFPGKTKRIHWSFEDPADATGTEAEILVVFRKVRDQISAKFKAFIVNPDLTIFDKN